MHGHLIAIEVGVESSTSERVELDSFTFDETRMERLNTKTMQGRSAVEQYARIFGEFFQNIPNLIMFTLDITGSATHIVRQFTFDNLSHDKRFEKFERHAFRQTTFVNIQSRTDDDYRTTGIIHTFTEQILTEATLFTFEDIRERTQLTFLAGSGEHGFTMTSIVVNESVHRFLQHAFFIATNNFRRIEFEQTRETIVAVDHAAIEIIQIGSGKTTTIKGDHWAQIRRNHRNIFHNHPFRTNIVFG